MNIIVCIKQVPDTETKIKLLPDSSAIDTNGIKWVINPYDEFAVEEALKLKEANAGAQVTVITAGPAKRASESLRTALAMGADNAVVIDTPENIDPTLAAKALSEAIKQEAGYNIIFTGKQAIDDNQASVSQMLAEFLKIPHATVVSKFSLSGTEATVERDTEGGTKEIIQLKLPCVIAANKGLNMPRYASLPGIMKAKKKTIKELNLAALNLEAGAAKIQFANFKLPSDKAPVKIVAGETVDQKVKELVRLVHEEAKAL
jgi:electron transfer flavoprotein beta subunit